MNYSKRFSCYGDEVEIVVPLEYKEVGFLPASVKKLDLHERVIEISDLVFEECNEIESVCVHPNNKVFYVEDGVLFKRIKKGKKELIRLELYPACRQGSKYKIPDNVSFIGTYAFANAKYLKELVFSDNLFYDDSTLFRPEFSESIENIVVPSFCEYLSFLKSPSWPKSIEIYQSNREKCPNNFGIIYKKDECTFVQGEKDLISSIYRPKYNTYLLQCDMDKEGEVFLPFEMLPKWRNCNPLSKLKGHKKVTGIIAPKFPMYWKDYECDLKLDSIVPLTLPRVDFKKTEDVDTKFSLLLGYLAHPEFYNDDSYLTSGLYLPYVTKQKHKILPYVYKIDRPDLLEFYAERNYINEKNFEKSFLNPAIEAGAVKCIEYLKQFKENYLESKKDENAKIYEENGITYAVTISKKSNTALHQKRLLKCNQNIVGDVYIPFNVIEIETDAFDGCGDIRAIIAPKFYEEKFDYAFNNGAIIPLVFPMIEFQTVKNDVVKTNLLLGYVAHPEYYEDCITGGFMGNTLGEDYLERVIQQKKKLLPHIFKLDRDDMLEFYALRGCITSKNFNEYYLKSAMDAGATKCIEFLTKWKAENL